ncbi:hypothetical protein OG900_37210 [Streptomyces sp. NBC_00433]
MASRGKPDLSWAGSHQLGPDLAGAVPANLTLLEPPAAGKNGTVHLRYGLADGTPATGDMSAPGRGVGNDA